MTKEVIISINGLQFADGEQDGIEVITAGNYYEKNDKIYIIYNEVLEDTGEVIKNTIKISSNSVEMIKKGSTNVHMVFEKNQKNITYYYTPYGEILVGITATSIECNRTQDMLKLKLEYSLEINYEHMSDCEIRLKVSSKESTQVGL